MPVKPTIRRKSRRPARAIAFHCLALTPFEGTPDLSCGPSCGRRGLARALAGEAGPRRTGCPEAARKLPGLRSLPRDDRHAARLLHDGRDTRRVAQGAERTADQANFSRRSTEHMLGRGQNPGVSLPELVDRYGPVPVNELDAANGWGVRHMAGNVYELTLSCWSDVHLGLSSDSAYLADAVSQQSCRRVAKGGAFNAAMDSIRPAARVRPAEDRGRDFLGFAWFGSLARSKESDATADPGAGPVGRCSPRRPSPARRDMSWRSRSGPA